MNKKEKTLNNKGFAISAVIYSILLLFIILLAAILTLLANRKIILEKTKRDLLEEVDEEALMGRAAAEIIVSKKNSGTEGLFQDKMGNVRYRGQHVQNYVQFNNELWRIIGVFDGKVKLIKDDVATKNFSWQYNGIDDWNYSTAMNGYPTIYDELIIFFSNISTSNQRMVAEQTYNLSGVATTEKDKEFLYSEELTNILQYHTGKVGLAYLSDYLYAAGESCVVGAYRYEECTEDNWMDAGMTSSWLLMTMKSSDTSKVLTVFAGGGVNFVTPNEDYRIRPVIYLKESVKLLKGKGTKESPYILSM